MLYSYYFFFKCLGKLINEGSGSGVSFMGRFLIKDMISSIDVVLSSYQSYCGFFEGSHFFLWLLSRLTSCVFFCLFVF